MAASTKSGLARMSRFHTEITPTGIISVDVVLGGGYESGDMIEIASPSGVGKSTVCLHMSKNLVKLPSAYHEGNMRVAYLDVERGVKHKIINNMHLGDIVGGDVGADLLLLQPQTYEDMEEVFDEIVVVDPKRKQVIYDHVFVDSISQVLPGKLLEKSVTDIEIGLEARQMSSFLKKYKPALRDSGTTVWFINQMRTKMEKRGMTMKVSQDSAGGNALRFSCDIRLRMDEGPKMTREENTANGIQKVPYGMNAHLYAIKNRNERSGIKFPIPIIHGLGVSNIVTLSELLKINDVITGGAGGYFTIRLGEEEIKVRGTGELNKWVKSNASRMKKYLVENDMMRLTKGEVS